MGLTVFPHIRLTGIISFLFKGHISSKVTVHKYIGIIRMWLLFEGGPYMRKDGMSNLVFLQG